MEANIRGRGMAWAAILLLTCGFCYSLGFQSGWSRGIDTINQRMDLVNQSLRDVADRAAASPSAQAESPAAHVSAG